MAQPAVKPSVGDESHASTKVTVDRVYKIFGRQAKEATRLARQGVGKDQILARLGCTVAVSDVSLEVRAQEILVVMGLSGSGKSTLVRMLNHLVAPTLGSVAIDGRSLGAMS